MNLNNFANAGLLEVQLAKLSEFHNQVEHYHEQKRVLYEQLLLEKITLQEYKSKKAAVDIELDRLQQIHSVTAAQTAQLQMDEKSRKARLKAAQEITKSSVLTTELVSALIERVYVYPGNQIEIIWKMKDFCVE